MTWQHFPQDRPQHEAPSLLGPGCVDFRSKYVNHPFSGKWFSGQYLGLGGQKEECTGIRVGKVVLFVGQDQICVLALPPASDVT